MYQEILATLTREGIPERAEVSKRYFKSDSIAEDEFLGIPVPKTRQIASRYKNVPFHTIEELIQSPIHEARLCGLIILDLRFAKADERTKQEIVELYLANTSYVNNWDLVDSSAPYILGAYLYDKSKQTLYDLAKSTDVWERRIAIVATLHYVKKSNFEEPLKISEMLLADKNHYIHKAIGWVLREISKKDARITKEFLAAHIDAIPRISLRYAIERFDEPTRKKYLEMEK